MIRINTSNPKNGYDLNYNVGNVQAFIDVFKIKKIKTIRETINKRKRNEREMRKGNESKSRRQKKKLKDKNKKIKNLTNNQVTNNFGEITIKNW